MQRVLFEIKVFLTLQGVLIMNVFRQIAPRAAYLVALMSCVVVLSCFIALPQGWASEKTYTNSIGMEFVLIPAGSFLRGSAADSNNGTPRERVIISQAFYLGKFEVTQSQWAAVMGDSRGGNIPIHTRSYEDAQAFLDKLNQMEGTTKYRLPSGDEWRYAERAGTDPIVPYEEDPAGPPYFWFWDNLNEPTHPKGQKDANPWGLHDMHSDYYGFRILFEQPAARVAFFPGGEGLEECLDALGRSNISFAPRGNEAMGGSLIDDAILIIPEKKYTVDVIKAELKGSGDIVPIRENEAYIGGSGEAGRALVFWWRMPEAMPPFVVVLNSGKKNEKIWWPKESGDDGSFVFSDEFVRHDTYGTTSR